MKADTGQLRERVVLKTRVSVSDGQGGRDVTWSTLATVWAAVRPASAREQLAAQSVSASVDYLVEMQYRTDVTPTMRLAWTPYRSSTQKTFEITSVVPKDGQPDRLLAQVVVLDA